MCAQAGEGFAGSAEPTRWENVVAEYADMFEPPSMPAEKDTMHCIKVEPVSDPPFRQQYRVSAAELAEVRCQLDDYLGKGWIRPLCLPYGAPMVFICKKTGELRKIFDYQALNWQTKKGRLPTPAD